MTVYETDIPGVGRRFELELGGETRVVVVLHHDGRCELFRRDGPDADGKKILDLTNDQANKLGSILEGAYFESVHVEELSLPLGEAFIQWVEVTGDCPVAGRSLGESNVRAETGATVIAIQRGEETIPNPDAEVELERGDLLVAVGTRKQHAALARLVAGEG